MTRSISTMGVLVAAALAAQVVLLGVVDEASGPGGVSPIGAVAFAGEDESLSSQQEEHGSEAASNTTEHYDEVVDRCRGSVAVATAEALADASVDRGSETLDEAADLLRWNPAAARRRVARVLQIPHPLETENRAWWLRGEAEHALGHYHDALDAWEMVGETPVDDYLELRRIETLLALGDADDAAFRAAELLESLDDGTSPSTHRARELRIESLAAAEMWDELVDEGAEFLRTYAEYPRRDQIWSWLAEGELRRGNLERAAAHFDRVVWAYPYRPLAHPAWSALQTLSSGGVSIPEHSLNDRFERALELRVNKHWSIVDDALADLLHDVVERGGDTSFANEIRYERARNAYGSGNFDAALTHLGEIVANGASGVRSWRLWTLHSDSYAMLGQIEDAVDALRHRDRGRSETHRHQELAELYLENGFYTESLQHYREVYGPRRMDDFDMTLLMFTAGEYDQAFANFENLADHSSGRNRRRARYWQARSLQEMGDLEEASQWFREIHDVWPRRYYGLQAQNRLMEIELFEPVLVAERDEHGAEAEEEGQGHPSLQALAEELVWGVNISLTGLVSREVPDLVIAEPEPGPGWVTRPARIHWDGPEGVGDAYLSYQVGDYEVTSAYVSPSDPQSFQTLAEEYGHLFPSLPRAHFLSSVGADEEAWYEEREASLEFRELDSSFGRRRPTSTRPIALRQMRFAHFVDRREVETGYWGIDIDGLRFPVPTRRAERDTLAQRHLDIFDERDDIRESYRDGLMVFGDYNLVRRFARARGGWSDTEPDGERRDDWSEAYPRAYPQLVTHFAEEWENNPYVIWALMNVESSFNPDSISRANARGLLQVIPKTGELISQRLGYWDFGPHNLMTPETSIEFGNYYFSELMTKFHGQELIAFAAYNAGPHNASEWLQGRGDLPLDAFIEMIPFDQAREYSKKVFRYVALYRSLYLGLDSLYVGNEIDPIFEYNIHF